MEYDKFYKFLEGRPLAELTKCQECVDEIVIKRTIDEKQEAIVEASNKDKCDSDVLDQKEKERLSKIMGNIVQSDLIVPHGMNGYNRDSKRFIRWLPGFNRPARPSIATEQNIPLDWFIHKELQLYIHWCPDGYFEMSCKDSLKFNQSYNPHLLLVPSSPSVTSASTKTDTAATKRKPVSFTLNGKPKKQKATGNAIAKDWSYFSESEEEAIPVEKTSTKSEDFLHADNVSETLSDSSKPPFLPQSSTSAEKPATVEPSLSALSQQPPPDPVAPPLTTSDQTEAPTASTNSKATTAVPPPLVLLPPPPLVPSTVSTSSEGSPRHRAAPAVGSTVRVTQGTHKGQEGMVLGTHWASEAVFRVQFHGKVVNFAAEHLEVVPTPASLLPPSPTPAPAPAPAPALAPAPAEAPITTPHVIPEMPLESQEEFKTEEPRVEETAGSNAAQEPMNAMSVLVGKWTADSEDNVPTTEIVHIGNGHNHVPSGTQIVRIGNGRSEAQSSAVLHKLRSTSIISAASGDSATDNGTETASIPSAPATDSHPTPPQRAATYRELRTPVTYSSERFVPRPMSMTTSNGAGTFIQPAYPTVASQQQSWGQPLQPPPPYQPPPPLYPHQAPYGHYDGPMGAYLPVQARPMYPPVAPYAGGQHYYNAPQYPAPASLQAPVLHVPPNMPRYMAPPMQPPPEVPTVAVVPDTMSASANSDTSDTANRTCWVRVKAGKYIHEEGEFVSQSPVDSTLARVRFYEHAGSKSRQVEIKVCHLVVFSLNNRAKEIPLDTYLTVWKMGAPGPKVLGKNELAPLALTQQASQERATNGPPHEARSERSLSTPDNRRHKGDSPLMERSTRPAHTENSSQSPQHSSPNRSNNDRQRYSGFSPHRSRTGDGDRDRIRDRDRDRDTDSNSDRTSSHISNHGRDRSRGRSRSRSRDREYYRERERTSDWGGGRTTGPRDRDSSEDERRRRQEERVRESEIDRAWEQIDRERRAERIRERSRERNREKERDGDRDGGGDRDWRRVDAAREKDNGYSRGRDSDSHRHYDRERAPVREFVSGRVSVSDMGGSINASPPSRSNSTKDATSTASTTRITTSYSTSSSTTSPSPSSTANISTTNSTPTTNGYLRNVMHAMNVPERVRAVGLAERPRDPFSQQAASQPSVAVAPPVIPAVSATAAQTSTSLPAMAPSIPSLSPSSTAPEYPSLGRGDLVQVTRGPHTGLIAVIVEPPDAPDSAQEYLVLLNDGRNSAARLTVGDFVATG